MRDVRRVFTRVFQNPAVTALRQPRGFVPELWADGIRDADIVFARLVPDGSRIPVFAEIDGRPLGRSEVSNGHLEGFARTLEVPCKDGDDVSLLRDFVRSVKNGPGETSREVALRLVREGLAALPLKAEDGPRDLVKANLALREASGLVPRRTSREDPLLAVIYDNLGWVCDELGWDEQAETYYLESLASQERAGWPPVVCDEWTLLRLAHVYARNGKRGLQLATLRKMQLQDECSCWRFSEAFARDPLVTSLRVALGRTALETNAACSSASEDTAAEGVS
jgi:hypothetical protein